LLFGWTASEYTVILSRSVARTVLLASEYVNESKFPGVKLSPVSSIPFQKSRRFARELRFDEQCV